MRWWSCIPCLPRVSAGPLVGTSGDQELTCKKADGASCLPWLPSFRRVRRSLSVSRGASAVAPEVEMEKDAGRAGEIPAIVVAAVRPTFLQRLFKKEQRRRRRKKHNISNSQAKGCLSQKESPSKIVILPHPPTPTDHTIMSSHSTPRSVARTLRQSSPSPNQASPSTPTSRTSKLLCNKKACDLTTKSDSFLTSLTIIVMLLMLAIGGRAFAIVSTCAFFYLSSYLRESPERNNVDSKGKKVATRADYESEKYRKRVLLEGLLERNGRRPTIF